MLGYIVQRFRGQDLYLRKYRVNARTKLFRWSPDKDDAIRMGTAKAIDLMKVMRGFCNPVMVDRRGCVITAGGKPKSKQELNAELKRLRQLRSFYAKYCGKTLRLWERWRKKNLVPVKPETTDILKASYEVNTPLVLRSRGNGHKPPVKELKSRKLDYAALSRKLESRIERLVLRQRQR